MKLRMNDTDFALKRSNPVPFTRNFGQCHYFWRRYRETPYRIFGILTAFNYTNFENWRWFIVRNKSLCYRDIINPINAKIVQFWWAARFCLLLVICLLIGIIWLPQNQYVISLSDLHERVANIMQIRK